MTKRLRLALYFLLSITTKSYAVDADNPVSCQREISHLNKTASKSTTQTQIQQPINVLVWNVQKFQNPTALTWLKERSAHIILIQESIASIQLEFAKALKVTQAFSPGYQTFDNETSGVGIVTKLPTMVNCAWQHEEPWLLSPKATLISALQVADKVMIVVNLHAVNFSIGTRELQMQLESISTVIDQYDGPVIVAGDFNTWSQARTNVLEQFIEQHELSAAHFEPDHRVRPFSYPLDHILTKNLEVLYTRAEENDFSDHAPLILAIRQEVPATSN